MITNSSKGGMNGVRESTIDRGADPLDEANNRVYELEI